MKIRENSIRYAIIKQKKIKLKNKDIETNILLLEKELEEKDLTNHQTRKIIDDLNTYKDELQLIIQHKTKGAITRIKARWYKKDEKNSKYFLNLEKRHCFL